MSCVTGTFDMVAASPRTIRNGSQAGGQIATRPGGAGDGSAFVDLIGGGSSPPAAQDVPVGQNPPAPADTFNAMQRIPRSIEQAYAEKTWQSDLGATTLEALRSGVSSFTPSVQLADQAQGTTSERASEGAVPVDALPPLSVVQTIDPTLTANTTLPPPQTLERIPELVVSKPSQPASATLNVTEISAVSALRQPDVSPADGNGVAVIGITVVLQEKHFGRDLACTTFAAITNNSTASSEVASSVTSFAKAPTNLGGRTEPAAATPGTLQMAVGTSRLDTLSASPAVKEAEITPPVIAAPLPEEAQPLAMTQQIVDAIKPHLAVVHNAASAQGSAVELARPSPGGSDQTNPVSVLVVRLEPAELGIVTVRLSMKGDVLTVKLEAGERGTAAMLENHRTGLIGDLVASGQKIGDLSVSLAAETTTLPEPFAKQSQPSSSTQGETTGMPLGGQASDGGGRGGGQFAGRTVPHQQSVLEGEEVNPAGGGMSRRVGIYL